VALVPPINAWHGMRRVGLAILSQTGNRSTGCWRHVAVIRSRFVIILPRILLHPRRPTQQPFRDIPILTLAPAAGVC